MRIFILLVCWEHCLSRWPVLSHCSLAFHHLYPLTVSCLFLRWWALWAGPVFVFCVCPAPGTILSCYTRIQLINNQKIMCACHVFILCLVHEQLPREAELHAQIWRTYSSMELLSQSWLVEMPMFEHGFLCQSGQLSLTLSRCLVPNISEIRHC